MNNMRTIRVTGRGRIKVMPDTTRITVSLEGGCEDYGETLRHSAQDTERLRELLSAFGFARSELKTLSFNVETEYESSVEDGSDQRRFVGYTYRHMMKLDFLSDPERLGRVLYALATCPIKTEFRLSYTVSDPEAVKHELLGKAVKDAGEKAVVLTKAAGVTLKDIQSIDCSWGEIDFEYRPMNRMLVADECLASRAFEGTGYEMDIEPDELEVSDTVTVLWEIG